MQKPATLKNTALQATKLKKYRSQKIAKLHLSGSGKVTVGAKLQATNRVPRPLDRGTATRYGG